jgi:hypothetical protein
MPPILVVSSFSRAIQVVPEVVVLRDRMDKIVEHLKWIKNVVVYDDVAEV